MKYWRIVKRVLWVLLSVVVAVTVFAFIVVRYYEDDVVEYALERVKKNLVTDMHIGEADLTFWSTFPHASLRFKEVYIQESFAEKDTLAYMGELSLGFSLSDVFYGEYKIHDIVAKRGLVRMKVDEKGIDNWHFWKVEPEDTSSVIFEISDIELSDLDFQYEDRKSEFFTSLKTDELNAEGAFNLESMEFDLEWKSKVESMISGEEEWLSARTVDLDAQMSLDLKTSAIYMTDGVLALDDLEALADVSYSFRDQSYLDAHVRGSNIDLNRIRKFLPEETSSIMEAYDLDGLLDIDALFKGRVDGKHVPDIIVNLSLSNGTMTDKDSGTSLSEVTAKANYTAGGKKTSKLEIAGLSANLGGGQFNISGTMSDMLAPIMDLKVDANANLEQVRSFFAIDTLETSTGNIQASAMIQGRISYKEDGTLDWSAIQCEGSATLADAQLKLKGSSREFTELQGTLALSQGNGSVQRFSGKVSGSDFSLHGTLVNLIPYLTTTDQVLDIQADLQSQYVNINELLEKNSTQVGEYALKLPVRMKGTFNASLGVLEFREFKAADIRGMIIIDGQKITADPIVFKTAGGNWFTQFGLQELYSGNYQLRCNADIDGIDITLLFQEFENFGQSFIQDKNLKGKTTAKIQFETEISPALDIVDHSVRSVIDISIENGELINLESLQSIAQYVRNNNWVAPFVNEEKFGEKLKNVKFSKLENVIQIDQGVITIPLMEIKSSAMDISARGTHTFTGVIDYSIGFNLRDILVRKEKDLEEVDDGLGRQMFLYMRGTTDNPEFGLDKDASRRNREEQVAIEMQNVKSLLKQEFGLFRKDDTVGSYSKEEVKQGTTMTVNWGENNVETEQDVDVKPSIKTSTTPKAVDTKKVGNAKKLPKWLQEKKEEETITPEEKNK